MSALAGHRGSRSTSPWRGVLLLLGAALAGSAACSATTSPGMAAPSGAHRRDGDVAIAAVGRESGETIRWEKGALTRGGEVTSFTVRGLEVGASGFDDLVVVGEVYDLDRPERLAGTYERVLADVARAEDSPTTVLGNEHGVLLVLRSADGESSVGPAPEGMVVELVP